MSAHRKRYQPRQPLAIASRAIAIVLQQPHPTPHCLPSPPTLLPIRCCPLFVRPSGSPCAFCPTRRRAGKADAPSRAANRKPLHSRFQLHKRGSRGYSLPSSSRSSSPYSSSSSSSLNDSNGQSAATRGPSFEPADVRQRDDESFMRLEFAKLQLQGYSSGPGAQGAANLFDDSGVQSWMEHQRARDHVSLALNPTQSPPVFYTPAHLPIRAPRPCPFPTPGSPSIVATPFAPAIRRPLRQPSIAVKKWHSVQKAADTRRADQMVYARIRCTAAGRWEEYQEKWARALITDDSPPLAFTDIPWPVLRIPHDIQHIKASEVHQIVLWTELEAATKAGVQRLSAEIKRWHPDKFHVRVLPFVVPHQRAAVAEAAAWVLDILIQAREDIREIARARAV